MKPSLLFLILVACGGSSTTAERDDDSSTKTSTAVGAEPSDAALTGIVKLHNDVRAEVGVDPLSWSDDVAAVAKKYAEKCSWGHNPERSGYGENIFASSAGSDPAAVLASWASEKKNYDASSGACNGGVCGHYTQIVWSKTTAVGCAKAICTSDGPFGKGAWDYWVCNYDPPGNYSGQKAF